MQRYRLTNKTKQIVYFLIIPFLALSTLAACRDYDFDINDSNSQTILDANKTTHFSFAFSVAGAKAKVAPSTRSKTTSNFKTDLSYWGKWGGNDSIASVTIYLFHRATGSTADYTYEETKTFPAAELQTVLQTDPKGDRVLFRPRKAIASTPGDKRIFVVVNPTPSISERIEREIVDNGGVGSYQSNSFNEFLHGANVVPFQTPNYPDAPTTTTRAGELVQQLGDKDAILMTGEPVTCSVADNLAEGDAWDNVPEAVVERAVARVVVSFDKSIAEDSYLDSDKDGNASDDVANFDWGGYTGKVLKDGDSNPLCYFSDVSWTVVQGASNLYFIKKEGKTVEFNYRFKGNTETEARNHPRQITTETTPAGNQSLPYVASYWDHLGEYSAIKDHFDSSGLWKPFHPMKHRANNFNTEGDSALEMSYAIANDAPCEYVLPSQLSDQRGTSAYVLVKAKIHPLTYYDDTGSQMEISSGVPFPNADVYFDPIEGDFYVDPDQNQNSNNCEKFTGGWCYYLFPLNSDAGSEKGWSSHINRNAYYHVQILGFNTVGLNWNPLVPYPDGVSADYAQKDFPENPHNPAPFPEDNKAFEFEVPLYLPSSYIMERLERDDESKYISAKRKKPQTVKDQNGQDKKVTIEYFWPNAQRAFHGLDPNP